MRPLSRRCIPIGAQFSAKVTQIQQGDLPRDDVPHAELAAATE
jgi:hypothetical protein